jgi:luciferase family oxidoreductase group 1
MGAASAIAATVQVGQFAEAAGYHRVWLAEHHAAPHNVCSQPAILIALVAARTSTIRVGSGGVMLPNHSPLSVAEQFHTLVAIHGARIDLGLGRAGGSDPRTLTALGRRPGADTDEGFTADLVELTGFLSGEWPEGHPSNGIRVSPSGPPPPMFLLGSSVRSARRAGQLGLDFAYARHLAPDAALQAADEYRAAYAAAGHARPGRLIMTIGVVCADTSEAADEAALRSGLIRLRAAGARAEGRTADSAELLDPRCTEAERAKVMHSYAASGFLIDDAEGVAAGLAELVDSTGADEIMLASAEFDAADRIRTLDAVAEGLAQRSAVPA